MKPSTKNNRANAEFGFMLIELMISMVVLSVGLAGLLVLLIAAMYNDRGSGGDTAATMVAEHVLEQISAEPANSAIGLTINDCAGTAWNISTAPAALGVGTAANGGNGANLTANAAFGEVIDWTQAYQPRMEERAKLGLKPDEPLKDKKACASLRDGQGLVIQDGMDNLNKALTLRQDYDDAMAYMNLLYREKADRECDEPDQRAADVKTADEWVDKTMDAKKRKSEKSSGANGITLDQKQ